MNVRLTMTAAALGLAAAAAVPAVAQDRDSHFSGPYIAGFGGSVSGGDNDGSILAFDTDNDGNHDDQVTTAAGVNAFGPGFCSGRSLGARPSDGCRTDRDKFEYGGRIGYDYRMSNFVVGGLIEASKNDSTDATSGFSTTPAGYALERQLKYNVSARLRAGYTPGGGMLFYVTGGGSMAKVNHRFSTTNTANSFTESRDGKRVFGWQAGGGGELMVTDNLSLGVEYLYNRYKDNKYEVLVGRGSAAANNPFLLASGGTSIKVSDPKYDFHSLRAVVGFHF